MDSTTDVMGFILGGVAREEEDTFTQAPMVFHTEENFTQCDETRNIQNGVGCELIQLHAIDKEKPTKESVSDERKTVVDEGEE
jgi:hypothetical protein